MLQTSDVEGMGLKFYVEKNLEIEKMRMVISVLAQT